MRIGMMSDSHGDMQAIDEVLKRAGKIDLWLHAGDCLPDARYLSLKSQTQVVAIAGNCDWPRPAAKEMETVQVGDLRIFLTHGHLFGVNFGLEALVKAAAGEQCTFAVYGHTHVARDIQSGAVRVLNPGSISRPRGGGPASFMILEMHAGKIHTDLIELI